MLWGGCGGGQGAPTPLPPRTRPVPTIHLKSFNPFHPVIWETTTTESGGEVLKPNTGESRGIFYSGSKPAGILLVSKLPWSVSQTLHD